jgi:hypothetical protein
MRYWLAAALASGALLAGCGDDKESDSKSGAEGAAAQDPKPPPPKEPLAETVKKLEAAAQGECKDYAPLLLHTIVRKRGTKPGAPPTKEECAQLEQSVKLYDDFKATKTYAFGPAAVVQGTGKEATGKRLVTAMLVQDGDGRYKATWGGVYDPQDAKPLPTSDFAGVAEKWVTATSKGDCDTMFRYFLGDSRAMVITKNDKVEFCENASKFFKRDDHLFADIAGDQGAHKPVELGKTLDIAFYGLPLASGRYAVLVLTTKNEDIDPKLQKGHDKYLGVLDYPTVVNPND